MLTKKYLTANTDTMLEASISDKITHKLSYRTRHIPINALVKFSVTATIYVQDF